MDIDLIKRHLKTARNKDLLDKSPDHRDQYGWTPLHAAVAFGKHRKVKKLLKKNKKLVNASNRDGWTPLHVVVGLSGDSDVWKEFSNILKALIDKGADCNARSKDGWTPMHVAAALHHDDIACVVNKLAKKCRKRKKSRKKKKCVDFFPEGRDSKGRTALHIAAAKNKDPEVIRILCERGFCLNAQDRAGDTPLHKAAAKTKNPEIVRLLIDNCADRWLKNGKEQLPFDLAKQNKKLKGTEVYWQLHKGAYYPPVTCAGCAAACARSDRCCGRSSACCHKRRACCRADGPRSPTGTRECRSPAGQ